MGELLARAVMRIWNGPPKWRGLRVMTASFLVGAVGTTLAILCDELRHPALATPLRWVLETVIVFAWALVVCGLLGMLIGILMNFLALFTRSQ